MSKKALAFLSLLIPLMMMGQNVTENMNNNLIPRQDSKADTKRLFVYESLHSVDETINRIEKQLQALNIPVFARFDHGKNAEEVKLDLRPTQVIVFGAPAVGTKLMQENQSISIELPLRIAVWEDASHKVWAAFPQMEVLAKEYGLGNDPVIGKMQTLLQNLVIKAGSAD